MSACRKPLTLNDAGGDPAKLGSIGDFIADPIMKDVTRALGGFVPFIAEIPKHSKPYPNGIEVINAGKCGMNAASPVACTFCEFGHLTECHYPLRCHEARCSHWERQAAAEWGRE